MIHDQFCILQKYTKIVECFIYNNNYKKVYGCRKCAHLVEMKSNLLIECFNQE